MHVLTSLLDSLYGIISLIFTYALNTFNKSPRLIGGDFNEVLRASEKFRENNINRNSVNAFSNYINKYKLTDLGFKG